MAGDAVNLDPTGPYIAAAFFCERLLEERSGVLSAVRIIDRIMAQAVGPEPPEQMPPTQLAITALIALKSGAARGRFKMVFTPEDPSGRKLDSHEFSVQLEGEERGVNHVINLNFIADIEGLYWFDVRLDDRLLTRMPLKVTYEPRRQPA